MTSPSLALPFSDEYFLYSRHVEQVVIPTSCHVYLPDNHDEFSCRSLVQPAPELGAQTWTTYGGKRALIGLYHDEGRQTAMPPALPMAWTRSGNILTVTISGGFKPHFNAGDKVKLWGVNVSYTQTTIISASIVGDTEVFTSRVPVQGGMSGSGTYQSLKEVNFYEDYVVFRSLPSLRLLTLAEVDALFTSYSPQATTTQYDLYDPISKTLVPAQGSSFYSSHTTNGSVNNPTTVHRQQFDEQGRALQQDYDAAGASTRIAHRFSKNQNATVMIEPLRVPDPADKLMVYDFYGFPLNDTTRGPFMAADLISYDSTAEDGLKRKLHNGKIAYDGPLFDEFGLRVVGAHSASQLLLRDSVMPLWIDQFNVPLKRPTSR